MKRSLLFVFGALALSCQEQGSAELVAPQPLFAEWEAAELRLDGEARTVLAALEVLARRPNADAALEAISTITMANADLHKTRLATVTELAQAAKTVRDLAAFEQQQQAAVARVSAAIRKLEKRIALGKKLAPPEAPAAQPVKPSDSQETEKAE